MRLRALDFYSITSPPAYSPNFTAIIQAVLAIQQRRYQVQFFNLLSKQSRFRL